MLADGNCVRIAERGYRAAYSCFTPLRCAQRGDVTRSRQLSGTLIRIVLRDSNVTIPTRLVITRPLRIDTHQRRFSLWGSGDISFWQAQKEKPPEASPGTFPWVIPPRRAQLARLLLCNMGSCNGASRPATPCGCVSCYAMEG